MTLQLLLFFIIVVRVYDFVSDFVATELINKLNFLEDEDQEAPTAMSTNPFDEPDDDIRPNHFNPFGDPDEEGMFNPVSKNILKLNLVDSVRNGGFVLIIR